MDYWARLSLRKLNYLFERNQIQFHSQQVFLLLPRPFCVMINERIVASFHPDSLYTICHPNSSLPTEFHVQPLPTYYADFPQHPVWLMVNFISGQKMKFLQEYNKMYLKGSVSVGTVSKGRTFANHSFGSLISWLNTALDGIT